MTQKVYSTQRVSNEYITLNNCGEQFLGNADYDTLREQGRVDYGIQFIEAGRCTFEDNGRVRVAGAGSLLLQFPGVRQHYSFQKEDNTHLMWAHFSGTSCQMLERLNTGETVHIKLSDVKTFKLVFDQMLKANNIRQSNYETICGGYITVLLGLILRSVDEQQEKALGQGREHLLKVIHYMNVNFAQSIDLKKYAHMCYVSPSRFMHLFKDYTGFSPYRFQLKIRVERAVEMLEYTSLRVEEIAELVGYEDCSYFCRIFKRFTGHTPLFYRKQ
ncbi:MAG: helix-turn-helix transcriptional regulator [Oscillospiraceae bacterium]|nr:helix-turn-helix transcriptional regulator [Oscillospiraceae bacterium]